MTIPARKAFPLRLAPKVGLNLRAAWSTEEHAGLGSYPGFLLGTTVAF